MLNQLPCAVRYAASALVLAASGTATAAEYPFLSEPQTLITASSENATILYFDAVEMINAERGLNEMLVVWVEDPDKDSGAENVIYGQRFSLETSEPIAQKMTISTGSEQTNVGAVKAKLPIAPVAVAADSANGRYAIGWQAAYERTSGGTTTHGGKEIFGRTVEVQDSGSADSSMSSVRFLSAAIGADDQTDISKNVRCCDHALSYNPFTQEFLLAWGANYSGTNDLYTQILDAQTLAPKSPGSVVYQKTSHNIDNGVQIHVAANPVEPGWRMTWQGTDASQTPNRRYLASKTLKANGALPQGTNADDATIHLPSSPFIGARIAFDPTPGVENFLLLDTIFNDINRLGYDGGGTEQGNFFRLAGLTKNPSTSRILLHSARTNLFLIGGRVTTAEPEIAQLRLFDSASSGPNTDGGPFNVFGITDDEATGNPDPGRFDAVAAADGLRHVFLFTSGEADSFPDTSTQIKFVSLNTEWADLGLVAENPDPVTMAGDDIELTFNLTNPLLQNMDARLNRAFGTRLAFNFNDGVAITNVEGCVLDTIEQVCVFDDVIAAGDSVPLIVTVSIPESATGTVSGTAVVESESHDPAADNNSVSINVSVKEPKPADPNDPNDPNNPNDPDDPSNPGDPSNPDDPGTPSSGGGGGVFGWLMFSVLAVGTARRTRVLA